MSDLLPPSEGDLDQVTAYLNEGLRNGRPAFEFGDQLRIYPNPILVDYNNVIADRYGERINPESAEAFAILRKVGTIFVVTTSTDWDWTHNHLNQNHLWDSKTILINGTNLSFYSKQNIRSIDVWTKLVDRFLKDFPDGYTIDPKLFEEILPGDKRIKELHLYLIKNV